VIAHSQKLLSHAACEQRRERQIGLHAAAYKLKKRYETDKQVLHGSLES
jgi:hypothetical protein